MQGGADDDKERFSGADTHSTGLPQQSHTDKELEEVCTSQGGVCLIGLLDATSEALPAHLKILGVVRSLRRCVPRSRQDLTKEWGQSAYISSSFHASLDLNQIDTYKHRCAG
jgi:hypothetical protein